MAREKKACKNVATKRSSRANQAEAGSDYGKTTRTTTDSKKSASKSTSRTKCCK